MDLDRLQAGTRPYLALTFPEPPAERPYVFINMIGSLDGKAVIEGDEGGLGSAEDRRRMQELRAHADAILNGAGTVRQSGASSRIRDADLVEWRRAHGKAADHPLGAIVSRRAEFPLRGGFFSGTGLRLVVFASEAAPERVAAIEAHGQRVVAVAGGDAGLREALAYLREREGVRLLLVEGGPTLNARLLRLGLVDEFFLTLSPTLVGGRDTLTVVEGDEPSSKEAVRRARPVHVLVNEESGELYLRYRLTGGS